MRTAWPFALACVAGCARPSISPDDRRAALALRDEVVATSRAAEHVRGLVDAAGPRLSGSRGDALGRAWALAKMREIGLSNVREEPVEVPVWRRGREEAALLGATPRALAVTALGGSVATQSPIEAPVVRFTTEAELRRAPDGSADGKIVFIDAVMPRRDDGAGYAATVWARGDGVREAQRLGARAVVIRSVGTDTDRLPHTGQTRYSPDWPKVPAAALSIPDADVLARAVARQEVALRLALEPSEGPRARGGNVVGELPGSARAGEIVLFGAHLDSWDLGEGALDDGAGCAIVLESARQLVARRLTPSRTVRFVLFANEENGLAGAFAYALAHADELPRHVVALEADAGDGKPRALRVHGTAATRTAFAEIAPLLAPTGVTVDPSEAEGGSDLIPLKGAGVPLIDVLQDETRYFDVHHTANDVLTKLDPHELDLATAAFATVLYAVAATPRPLR